MNSIPDYDLTPAEQIAIRRHLEARLRELERLQVRMDVYLRSQVEYEYLERWENAFVIGWANRDKLLKGFSVN